MMLKIIDDRKDTTPALINNFEAVFYDFHNHKEELSHLLCFRLPNETKAFAFIFNTKARVLAAIEMIYRGDSIITPGQIDWFIASHPNEFGKE